MSETKLGDAQTALFENKISALVIACPQNERPLHGLAGLLDWRFHGAISAGLRSGIVTGKPGECSYIPVTKNGKTYHLLLIGSGNSAGPGQRTVLPSESVETLKKNLSALKLSRAGYSKSDLGTSLEMDSLQGFA